MDFQDYNALLGVPKTASEKETRSAHRKLARRPRQRRRIRRLRDDLGLNLDGIEVALRQVDEIESLRPRPGASGPRRGRMSAAIEPDGGGSNGQL